MDVEEFFRGYKNSRSIFNALHQRLASLPDVSMAVTKSQVAFQRHRAFAWAWVPGRYLHG